jgi:hypothetical protein
MQKLLYAAGTEFLRVFGITFLAFATGILGATNLSSAVALSIAGLAASLAAAIRAVTVFVPSLTFAGLIPQPYAAWADAFVRAFLANGLATLAGWLAAPNWSAWHAALLGIITGAAVAGVRALQGLFTPGEVPAPGFGMTVPLTRRFAKNA